MATQVVYNGVTLHNVTTRSWTQEVRYDQSNTDAMFHTFNMHFEGYLHQQSTGDVPTTYVSSTYGNMSMPINYASVMAKILKTRAVLRVNTIDDAGVSSVLFRCDPVPGDAGTPATLDQLIGNMNRDVDNGPKPKAFRILQVVGSKCLKVSFEIECSKLVCSPDYVGNGVISTIMPVVLSNRWSLEEAMDENLFTTRTISGRMRLSAAVATMGTDAKWIVVPGLEDGFRRSAVNFSVEPDGLACSYRVIDRQVHTSAPWPATKMEVRHQQSTNEGINMTSEVQVTLEGSPDADKKLLFSRAMAIIDAKLNFAQIASPDNFNARYIPQFIGFTDYIGESNRIDATVRFFETPAPKEGEQDVVAIKKMMGNLRANMGYPLTLPLLAEAEDDTEYDPGVSRMPALYGYYPPRRDESSGSERRPAILMLLQCYLQQPCVNNHRIFSAQISGSEEEEEPPYEPTEVVEKPKSELDYVPEPDKWSASAKQSVYTYSRITSRYETDENRIQLPTTATVTPGTPADTSEFFRVGGAQCRRIIEADAERAGSPPEVPKPVDTYTDGNLRGKLLSRDIEVHPPTLTADGVTPLHRITARYVYGMNRPPELNEGFRIGVAPQTNFEHDEGEVRFRPDIVFQNPNQLP